MEYVSHPLIRPKSLEARSYQLNLARLCSLENCLIVLPTGLGKTAIALLVIADTLLKERGRCIFLAPTRVLVEQHRRFLAERLLLEPQEIVQITGEEPPSRRAPRWTSRVVCATPQVLLSDIDHERTSLKGIGLMIFDEAHRAVGEHPYCKIARALIDAEPKARILGMTASLPWEVERVRGIMERLGLKRLEARDEGSKDILPYIQRSELQGITIELPPILAKIRSNLQEALEERIDALRKMGILPNGKIGTKQLLEARELLEGVKGEARVHLYSALRLSHALNQLETQSLEAFINFMDRILSHTRGIGIHSLKEDERVREALEMAKGAKGLGLEHPKLKRLLEILEPYRDGGRVLVFASYRDTVEALYRALVERGFKAGYLIGKGSREGSTRGLSQEEQVRMVELLRKGEICVLVATQVGEEGLDIAECGAVIFYDNVPSAIRFIQRMGRTGRKVPGKVYLLMTEGTRDEHYYWAGRRRLQRVRWILKKAERRGRFTLDGYL